MYAFITGSVYLIGPNWVVLSTSGGVGYEIVVSPTLASCLEEHRPCTLYVRHVQREDGQWLYGFLSRSGAEMFAALCTVNGVGPGTAMSMLSAFDEGRIGGAIATGDLSLLKSIKGVGEKTAQQVLLQLGAKMERIYGVAANDDSFVALGSDVDGEVILALRALGLTAKEAKESLAAAMNLPERWNDGCGTVSWLTAAALKLYYSGKR